ncbi:FliM/FliN family flagellar motor switch protein [Candidatus Phycosocius spiralis]|uniref:Flagellar motor switch protein FliN n=1 Tax=Candidatus Phycosocius spiralis TaxID=2815099 RepID=A0ABQ4PYF2_9PROT|nr:FliM/FliN family flagellar motor switch protein [Candidatus Phycosocius spiralis]GIU68048.1 hypothetical protein PsB1_2202 [Candidatus Phycosocius spiralis]
MTIDLKRSEQVTDVRTAVLETLNVRVEAFVGHAEMTVSEIINAKPGTIISLDTPLNEIVELRVKGQTVAKGELVAVGDCFGVRVTEILSA